MTIEQARELKQGQYVYHTEKKNAYGKTPMRARVTSVKTWKTRPGEIIVNVKHGIYGYDSFSADQLYQITAEETK